MERYHSSDLVASRPQVAGDYEPVRADLYDHDDSEYVVGRFVARAPQPHQAHQARALARRAAAMPAAYASECPTPAPIPAPIPAPVPAPAPAAPAPAIDPRRLVASLALTVTPLGPAQYRVTGGREPHHVDLTADGAALPPCDCGDALYRGTICKHQLICRLVAGDPAVRAAILRELVATAQGAVGVA